MAQAFVCDECGKAATHTGNWRRVAVSTVSTGRLAADPVTALFTSSFREVPASHSGDYCSVDCAVAGVAKAIIAAWPTEQSGPVREGVALLRRIDEVIGEQ